MDQGFRSVTFYDIPGNDLIQINRAGDCLNKRTGNIIAQTLIPSGYVMVMINVAGKTANFYHHRLMALTFVERPLRHHDKPFDELEVNHINGIKNQNNPENLEWCTPQENSMHAIEQGLTYHQAVFARNLATNEVQAFATATECAKHFKIGMKRLVKHLRSKLSGYVSKDNHVFMYPESLPWPSLRDEHMQPDTWEQRFGVWVATQGEQKETKIVIADTLKELCAALDFPFTATQTYLNRHPEGTPYQGWVFVYDDYALVEGVDRARRHAGRTLFPAKEVTATNKRTGEIYQYASRNAAASALGIHSDHIRYALKAKEGAYKDYVFVESDFKTAIQ